MENEISQQAVNPDFMTWFMTMLNPYFSEALRVAWSLLDFRYIPALSLGAAYFIHKTRLKDWATTSDKRGRIVQVWGMLLGLMFISYFIYFNPGDEKGLILRILSIFVSYVVTVLCYDYGYKKIKGWLKR